MIFYFYVKRINYDPAFFPNSLTVIVSKNTTYIQKKFKLLHNMIDNMINIDSTEWIFFLIFTD